MPAAENSTVSELLTSGRAFLTFGGVETHLLFQQGFPLREFCAFEIFEDEPAWTKLQETFLRPALEAAASHGHGFIADSLVWRAAPDYLAKLDYPRQAVARFNRLAVQRLRQFVRDWEAQSAHASSAGPVLVKGELGPRGDGYAVAGVQTVTPDDAFEYHSAQVRILAEAGVDLVAPLTMTSANETIGMVRAARDVQLPVVVSPTVETDGRLPDGASLQDYVRQVDDATGGYPIFYMANCAHPTHIESTLSQARDRGESWVERFRGLRANASTKSHEELDNSPELDRGDPLDFGTRVAALKNAHDLVVVGGCCGTDVEHIREIAQRV